MVIDVSLPPPARLELGRQGENAITSFEFDISAWVDEYGAGTLILTVQRSGDDEPYPVMLDGGDTWIVSNADTATNGIGMAQLEYRVDEQVKKSVIYSTLVLPSIEASADPPSPLKPWVDEILEAAEDAEDAASASLGYAQDSKGYADDSKGYADDAKEYAEAAASVFTYTDTGDGNIVITRSADNG